MGCSSSKLHPLGYEKYDLLDENVEQKKGFHSSFHEEFDIGLCQTNAPIVTFVESVSCCSRSISCDSEETMSATTPTIEQSRPSQSSFKLQDDFELSETGANAPVDDESDLKEWLREIEETICTNPNQVFIECVFSCVVLDRSVHFPFLVLQRFPYAYPIRIVSVEPTTPTHQSRRVGSYDRCSNDEGTQQQFLQEDNNRRRNAIR